MHVNPLHTVTVVAEICPSGAATVAVGGGVPAGEPATLAVGEGVTAGEPATVVAGREPATFVAEGLEPEADGSCKS